MHRYYRHFKGGTYKILCEAKDSSTLEDVIVYQALYGEGQIWTRPKNEFFDYVEREEYSGPRFMDITEDEVFSKQ